MAKIFKVHGYFIDSNDSYTKNDLEIALEEKMGDLFTQHLKVEERDIGEWYDDIPLNLNDCPEYECEVYFRGDNNNDTL